jgi:hypothetical protein
MTRPLTRQALVILGLLLTAPPAPAQVKYAPRPATLDIQIRYRIRTDRDERVRQFRVLEAHLKGLGFVPTPREDADLEILDRTAEYFSGTIPSANVFAVLNDPRVRTILFAPAGHAYPDSTDKPVPIRVGIPTGFLPADQQQLHNQVVAQLQRLGFREAVGYDHRGYTIVRGDIPYGNLFRLLKDLRREPSGWFMADTPPEQLPAPIRDLLPIRWVEVLADADLTPATPPLLPSNRLRMTPDLRAVMDDPMSKDRPLRVELILNEPVDDRGADLIRTRLRTGFITVSEDPVSKLRVTEHATIEGVVGNIITLRFLRPADLERFMYEVGVVGARLPREAVETVAPIAPEAVAKRTTVEQALAATRMDELHRRGYRGKGVRVVVIGSDFTGAAELIGKGLPASTRVVDLTAELSPTILPAPPFPNRTGTGTVTAQTVHAAAPDAELTLVRVDPSAFFQLLTIARLVRGDPGYSDALQSRIVELSFAADDHRIRYREAVDEYRQAFANLSDEERPRQRRENARKALEALQVEEKELTTRIERSTAMQRASRSLAGAQVVVNSLVWESGYPLDGLSELSTAIDLGFAGEAVVPAGVPRSATRRTVRPPTVWVQAASNSGASVWGGMYRDADANGVMEFAAPSERLPPGTWTRELNFLATRTVEGKLVPTLPAGMKVRLVAQWREPRDPNVPEMLIPTHQVRLGIFQQLDPEGTKRASDELAEVARSAQEPYLVRRTATYLVFEQVVEWTVGAEGRYAVRVDVPRPTAPLLPALAGGAEIYPRFHVERVGAKPDDSRLVFETFVTSSGGVGIPGDSASALTIAGSAAHQLLGGGTGIALRMKPNFLAADDIAVGQTAVRGPAIAAGFAGGVAACLIQTGASVNDVFGVAGVEPGHAIVLPPEWFKRLPPRP